MYVCVFDGCICVYVCMYVHTYVVYMYVRMYVCMYVYTYIHVCMYVYIYRYKETKFEVSGWLSRDMVVEDRQRLRPWAQQCWQTSIQIPLLIFMSIGVVAGARTGSCPFLL